MNNSIFSKSNVLLDNKISCSDTLITQNLREPSDALVSEAGNGVNLKDNLQSIIEQSNIFSDKMEASEEQREEDQIKIKSFGETMDIENESISLNDRDVVHLTKEFDKEDNLHQKDIKFGSENTCNANPHKSEKNSESNVMKTSNPLQLSDLDNDKFREESSILLNEEASIPLQKEELNGSSHNSDNVSNNDSNEPETVSLENSRTDSDNSDSYSYSTSQQTEGECFVSKNNVDRLSLTNEQKCKLISQKNSDNSTLRDASTNEKLLTKNENSTNPNSGKDITTSLQKEDLPTKFNESNTCVIQETGDCNSIVSSNGVEIVHEDNDCISTASSNDIESVLEGSASSNCVEPVHENDDCHSIARANKVEPVQHCNSPERSNNVELVVEEIDINSIEPVHDISDSSSTSSSSNVEPVLDDNDTNSVESIHEDSDGNSTASSNNKPVLDGNGGSYYVEPVYGNNDCNTIATSNKVEPVHKENDANSVEPIQHCNSSASANNLEPVLEESDIHSIASSNSVAPVHKDDESNGTSISSNIEPVLEDINNVESSNNVEPIRGDIDINSTASSNNKPELEDNGNSNCVEPVHKNNDYNNKVEPVHEDIDGYSVESSNSDEPIHEDSDSNTDSSNNKPGLDGNDISMTGSNSVEPVYEDDDNSNSTSSSNIKPVHEDNDSNSIASSNSVEPVSDSEVENLNHFKENVATEHVETTSDRSTPLGNITYDVSDSQDDTIEQTSRSNEKQKEDFCLKNDDLSTHSADHCSLYISSSSTTTRKRSVDDILTEHELNHKRSKLSEVEMASIAEESTDERIESANVLQEENTVTSFSHLTDSECDMFEDSDKLSKNKDEIQDDPESDNESSRSFERSISENTSFEDDSEELPKLLSQKKEGEIAMHSQTSESKENKIVSENSSLFALMNIERSHDSGITTEEKFIKDNLSEKIILQEASNQLGNETYTVNELNLESRMNVVKCEPDKTIVDRLPKVNGNSNYSSNSSINDLTKCDDIKINNLDNSLLVPNKCEPSKDCDVNEGKSENKATEIAMQLSDIVMIDLSESPKAVEVKKDSKEQLQIIKKDLSIGSDNSKASQEVEENKKDLKEQLQIKKDLSIGCDNSKASQVLNSLANIKSCEASKFGLKECKVNLSESKISQSMLMTTSQDLLLCKPNFCKLKRKLEDMLHAAEMEEEKASNQFKKMKEEKSTILKKIVLEISKVKRKYNL